MKWLTSNKLTVIIKITLMGAIFLLLALAFFSQPAADDYGQIHRIQTMGFWNAQVYWYNNMNGRFFYMFIFSLYSVIFGLSNYWIYTWFIYGFLFMSIYLLFYSFGSRFFSKRTLAWSSLAFILIYVSRLPRLSEAFYWLAGAMSYQLGNSLFILLIMVLYLMLHQTSQIKRLIYALTSTLLAASVVAINEIFILPLIMGLTISVIFLLFKKNPNSWFVLCVFLVCCVSLYFVIKAPGTHARSVYFPNRHKFWYSLISSIRWTFGFFKQWAFDPLILSSTLLLLPSFSKMTNRIVVTKNTKRILFFFPVVWLSVLISSFFTIFWAVGGFPPDRSINSIFLFFLLGWYSSIAILTLHFYARQKTNCILPQYLRTTMTIIFVLSLLCFPNLYTAIKDLLFHAYPYRQEVQKRIDSARRSVSENREYMVIHPLKNRPISLFSPNFEFKGDSEHHWVDYDWELYWGLKVIFQDEPDNQ